MKKTTYVILFSSLICIALVISANQKIAKSQVLESMPDNITLRVGETFSNRDLAIFFAFCGVEGNFFGGGPNAIEVGHILKVFPSDLFGTDQVCVVLVQEGDSVFFREFEYQVTTLQSGLLFLEKQ